jgi:general secretion pathway protein C
MKGMWHRTSLPSALSAMTFAAACAVALAVGWTDWQRLAVLAPEPPPAATGPAPDAETLPAAGPDRAAALARLPEVPLFGRVVADAPASTVEAAPPVDEAELPEASASFQIFGLIDAAQPARARAILGSSDADQREYRVGEETPDGARLHAIRPRSLVLDRDGRLELVKLPETGTVGGDAPLVRPHFVPRPVARLTPPPAPDEATGVPPDDTP